MAVARYLFKVYQGSTFRERYEFLDSESNPIDFTGYECRMQIRPSYTSDTVFCNISSSIDNDGTGINMTPVSSSIALPRSSGSISLEISAASSSLFTFDEAVYDIEAYSGSYVSRLMEGKVKLFKNVTR